MVCNEWDPSLQRRRGNEFDLGWCKKVKPYEAFDNFLANNKDLVSKLEVAGIPRLKPYTFDRKINYSAKAKEHIKWAFAASY